MASKTDGAHHERASQRYKLFQPTEMSVAGATHRVHMLNLSSGGALIYAVDPPAVGISVRLRCGARWFSARVAWRNQRRFGVEFAGTLTEADVELMIVAEEEALAAASRRMAGQALPPQLSTSSTARLAAQIRRSTR